MHERATRITFVRHGESVANRVQRWQGQGDSPLSDRGREQAAAVGARLGSRKFDRVIASDLSRAVDTAAATGFSFEKNPGFREFDVGRWEGLTREEVLERYPEEMERLKAGEDIPLGGGESYATFSERIDRELNKLRASMTEGEHVLVVCHGGVIGTALAGLLGLRGKARWPFARISNTSITEFVFTKGRAEMLVYNDTLHLSSMGLYPERAESFTAVALVADDEPASEHGVFSAQYDARAPGPVALGALERLLYAPETSAPNPALVHEAIIELSSTHKDERVALCLSAALIHAFAEDALWLGASKTARLGPPRRGALCHVAKLNGRATLLDYGVSTG